MNPKTKAVLAHLCTRLGPLTKTRAVKLPYLVDVVAQHVLGRSVAEGEYETWELGVVTREIYAFMTHSDGDEQFVVEEHQYSEGGRQIRLRQGLAGDLSPEERIVVDAVADQLGHLDAARLGLLTKALNPELEPEAWGSNRHPLLGEDAYARLTGGWLELFEKLPYLDLTDEDQLERVDDPREHLRRELGA